MSTAPAGPLPDPPPSQPGQPPGPWALLAATAVGGVIGTRLGRTPLVLAAGAAALALLQKQKRSAPASSASPSPHPLEPVAPAPGTEWKPASPTLPPPVQHVQSHPPAHESPQSQVEAWLSKQMQREMAEPVLDLSLHAQDAAAAPAPAAGQAFFPAGFSTPVVQAMPAPVPENDGREPAQNEDDYHPGAFLLDEAESLPQPRQMPAQAQGRHEAFAQLTAPRDLYVNLEPCEPAQPLEPTAAMPAVMMPLQVELTHSEPAFFSTPAPARAASPFQTGASAMVQMYPPADATAPLNLEPLPSLTESAPHVPTAGALFFAAPPPLQQVERDPQPHALQEVPPPEAAAQVFEGAAFPDAIDVPMAFGLDEIPAVLFKEKTPASEGALPDSSTPVQSGAYTLPQMHLHAATAMPFFNAVEPTREIEVQLASPGEASFDPPLAAAPQDPWQAQMEAAMAGAVSAPELDAETGLLTAHASPSSPYWPVPRSDAASATPVDVAAPAHAFSGGPVVDAEIVIKPRAQDDTRPVFVAKPRPLAPSFAAAAAHQAQVNVHLHLHAHSHPHAGLHGTQDLRAPLETPPEAEAPFPSPLQPPRPHTRRSSWHSWWQGD